MDGEILIRVTSLKKKYCRSLKRSMLYGISDISKDIFGISNEPCKLREDEFWCLDDISFELKRGECIGIIGANGAGKSTLLKLITGISLPSSGEIMTVGRVSSLIEVGAGFHPMLSGRENIYIKASILGMSKSEIDANFNSIVEFSELEDSIDMPVKLYSSGMYVRLGFAISVHVNLDILILDEVFAVGDLSFISKCFRYISSIKSKTAIVLVSHDMRNISRMCDLVMFVEKGKVKYIGNTNEGIEQYRKASQSALLPIHHCLSENVTVYDVRATEIVNQFQKLAIDFKVSIELIEKIVINIQIHREDGLHCCAMMSKVMNIDKANDITCIVDNVTLMPGNYYLSISILDENKTGKLYYAENIKYFKVLGDEETAGVYSPNSNWFISQ